MRKKSLQIFKGEDAALCFLIGMLLLTGAPALFSQSTGNSGGTEAGDEADSLLDKLSGLADETVARVETAADRRSGDTVVSAAGILYRENPTPLGETFASLVISRLANLDNPRIIPITRQYQEILEAANTAEENQRDVPSADILISGIAFEDADEMLLDIQLIQPADHRILAGIETRLALTPQIRRSLAPASSSSARTAGDSREPNNSPEQATPLEVGESLSNLSLLPAGDTDWFVLEPEGPEDRESGESPEPYLLDIASTGTTDTYMLLYGPDDPSRLIMENDDRDGQNAGVSTLISPGSRYYIQVRGYSSSTEGPYGLQTGLEPANLDSFEPNNSREEATEITLNTPAQEHRLAPPSDEDWFHLSAPESESPYRIELTTLGSLDTFMELYSPGGTLLDSDDDSGQDNNARVVRTITNPEEMFILVRGYDSSVEGSYQFQISREILQTDDYEPDNSRSEAGLLELNGKPQSRSFSTGGDEDWVRLELEEEEVVILETTGDSDTFLRLEDSKGNILVRDDDSGSSLNARIQEQLNPGTYYLVITPVAEDAVNAPYILHGSTY